MSPSSVKREAKATHSGNAHLHGMTNVTAASIVYIATQVQVGSTNFCDASKYLKSLCQVHFALSSSPVFCRLDTVSDSERFYLSVLELFNDVEELNEVNDLLAWWNRYEEFHLVLSWRWKVIHVIQTSVSQSAPFPPPCQKCTWAHQSQAQAIK